MLKKCLHLLKLVPNRITGFRNTFQENCLIRIYIDRNICKALTIVSFFLIALKNALKNVRVQRTSHSTF